MENQHTPNLLRMWGTGFGKIATRSLQVLIVGALIAVALKMVFTVQLVLLPILIALILSSALWPLVRKLRMRMSDLMAAVVALLACFVSIGSLSFLITIAVKNQWERLTSEAVKGFSELQSHIEQWLHFIDQKQLDELGESFKKFLTSDTFGTGAIHGISAVGSFLAGLTLTFVILFFFLKDGDKIWAFFLSWMPKNRLDKFRKSGVQAVLTLGDYIRGTALVSLVDTVGIAIGLFILQVPLAIPLSAIIFLGGFIPMVGATFAGVLASLVTLVTNGFVEALIVAGIVVLVNQLEGNFLQPKIMAKALSVHGLIVLVSLTAGTVLGGILGAILAVPLTATAWGIIKIWTGRQTPEDKQRLNRVRALERISKMQSS